MMALLLALALPQTIQVGAALPPTKKPGNPTGPRCVTLFPEGLRV